MASIIDTNIESGVLTIRCDGRVITVRPSDFATDIKEQAMLHGFKQKIVDAAALSRNPDTGASATASDKYHAMQDVVAQLSQGDWNRRAAGDGTASMGLLVAALIRVTGNDRDAVEATVKGWTPEQQAAMRADPTVAPVVAAIKAERAAKTPGVAKVDTTGLLATLTGVPKVVLDHVAANPDAQKKLVAKAKKAA